MSIDDRLNQESSIIDEKNIATSLIDFDLSLIEQNLSKNSTNSNRKKANSENRIRINVGEDDELELIGYCFSIWRIILIISLTLLSGGIFSILLLIKPALRVRLLWKQCPLEKATVLLVKDRFGNEYKESLEEMPIYSYRYFIHKKLKYVWNSEFKYFFKLRGLDSQKCSMIYSQIEGTTTSEADLKLNLFGSNSIEIEVLPIWKLVLNEITGPFYLYQFFIIIVWLIQLYYQFAFCILILSTISVTLHVWQTRRQALALRKKVQSASLVTVIRDNIIVEKISTELVPGDVIVLGRNSHTDLDHSLMECDAVLMHGSCIMDESMLTGESCPVPKVPLVDNPSIVYSSSVHRSNTLFSGTRIMNINSRDGSDVRAVVVRTGFSTTKGELARSILFPIEMNNKLKIQMIKLSIIFVIFIGVPSFIYTYLILEPFDFPLYDIMIIVLDVGTFLIPPILPAILTSVNVHAQRRLKRKGIFCLNSPSIACSGEIDLMCFDKTGTLTEDTIDFAGLVPISSKKFQPAVNEIESIPNDHLIVKIMASCHSLVRYKNVVEGEDLDKKLFLASKWQILSKTPEAIDFGRTPERIVQSDGQLIGIMKQFPFESFLQRMLVLAKDMKDNRLLVMMKGAPEIMKSFVLPQSIPSNFDDILESYTRKGYRVLAAASKTLESDDLDECCEMNRNDLESDLSFNGFYLFKNKLKSNSTETLKELSDANIRCIMATGDNIQTAITVAQECEMIKKSEAIIRIQVVPKPLQTGSNIRFTYVKYPDFIPLNNNDESESQVNFPYHLAIDGDSFSLIKLMRPELIEKIVHKGTIFARMTPNQKLNLINLLRKQDHSVGMCGDGANDCGALRASDAGIALSVAEASVASPFTYKNKDISCVPSLIKEGRCTLVSIFGTFKYQVAYCFILLGAVLILFLHGTKPSDGTYVFVDIIMNILPPMVFATTEPFDKLSKRIPSRNLLGLVPQLSIYLFIIIQVSIYYAIRTLLIKQDWYQEVQNDNIDFPLPNQVSNAIFACNTISYVIAAIVFAPGPPFRKGFFSNKIYMLMVLINLILSLLISLVAPKFLLDYLEFIPIPIEFRGLILFVMAINFVVSITLDKFILDIAVNDHLLPWIKQRFHLRSKKRYKLLDEQIHQERWPFDNLIEPLDYRSTETVQPYSMKKSSSLYF